MLIMPIKGKQTKGSRAVTGIGAASDTHHVIIHAANASTLPAPGEINSAGNTVIRIIKSKGPRTNPIWRPERDAIFTIDYVLWGIFETVVGPIFKLVISKKKVYATLILDYSEIFCILAKVND